MTAVDTNILVRFLVRDDERQAQAVYRRFKRAESSGERFFIPLLVVLETIWVLESVYEKERTAILNAFQSLRRMPIIEFERDPVVDRFLAEGRAGRVDLSDILIAGAAEECGCKEGITFDKGAAKLPFFTLLT